MGQSELHAKFRWVCAHLFPRWDSAGWQVVFADMPVYDGLVYHESKTIDIASRLTDEHEIILILVHEAAHAVTETRDHSTLWRDVVKRASKLARMSGDRRLATLLEKEAKHESLIETLEQFYEWMDSYLRDNPHTSFDVFAGDVARGLQTSKEALLAECPLMKRKFKATQALLKLAEQGETELRELKRGRT